VRTDLPDSLDLDALLPTAARGEVELVADGEHFERVVVEGMLAATSSLEVMTADLKAMLVPSRTGRSAPSIIQHLAKLAKAGVEVRVLHASVPSSAALDELKKLGKGVDRLTLRRCPRVHAKTVIVDAGRMYLGSANVTGAGLGAKGATRRNFELGVITEAGDLIDAVLERFNRLWEGAHCDGCGRRDVCPHPLEEPDL